MRLFWILVSAGVGAALVGLVTVRAFVSPDALAAFNDVTGSYLQTLGGNYGVLVGFVIFVVWGQFNDARRAVEREANELADLARVARGYGGEVGARLLGALRAYADSVVGDEWASLACGRPSAGAAAHLRRAGGCLTSLEPATAREQTLFAEALARFNDLNDARSDRILMSRVRLPRPLAILVSAGGVLVIASVYLFGLRSFAMHALITAAVAGSVSFVLFLVFDLDNPFYGYWQVSAEPIRSVLAEIDGEAAAEVDGEGAPR